MVFEHVRLHANERVLAETVAFYEERLELPGLAVGETRLELAPTGADAFYHVAFLVPGDRFEAALAWARERVELLPDRESGDLVFDFSNWDALACYFHDPAGSIVELIAHRGVGERGALDEPGRLAFVGEKARTLILAPPGRGWLPTGRPAVEHPVDAVVTAPRAGEAQSSSRAIRIASTISPPARR